MNSIRFFLNITMFDDKIELTCGPTFSVIFFWFSKELCKQNDRIVRLAPTIIFLGGNYGEKISEEDGWKEK